MVDGREVVSSQANNMFVFPGLALGAYLAQSTVSDSMLMAAAEAVSNAVPQEVIDEGGVYPDLDDIRDISADVALTVIKQARAEGRLVSRKVLAHLEEGEEMTTNWIKRSMYRPIYGPIVSLPPGVNE